jgi:hypothetical protein
MDAPAERASPAPSARFLALGAAAAALYVAAQVFQAWAFRYGLPAGSGIEAEVATRLLPLDRARQLAVFASLAAIPAAYAALALATARRAPGAALVGLIGGVAFSILETAYRSIDLFAGHAWAQEFAAAGDPALRAALAERFALFDEVVAALYLPLLLAHAAASFAFAAAAWSPARRDRALAAGWLANGARATLRTLQMHGGVVALAPINAALYLPVSLATYGLLALWLARAARAARVA